MLLILVAVIGGIAFVGLAVVSQATAVNYTCDEQVPAPSGDPPAAGEERPDFGSTHVASGSEIDYAECPPTSGNHYPSPGGPLRPGYYGPDSKAPPGGWIHDLEHGFIVVLYRNDAPDLAAVRRFVDLAPATSTAAACGYRAKVVVARFDAMSTPYAVLAWRRLLLLPEWDETKALTFAHQWIEVTGLENGAC